MDYKVGDPVWVWKDGYLIHDYIFMVSQTYVLTQSARCCRPKGQVFRTLEDGIVWMEQGIRVMRRKELNE